MIPADYWHDNRDGTAWVVTHGGLGIDLFDSFERPCDTCQGQAPYGTVIDDVWIDHCPDCGGTGRHTFTVEMVRVYDEPGTENKSGERYTLRVSVVPGMVLPIVTPDSYENPSIWHCSHRDMWFHYGLDGSETSITLPPAADPGMWAVQLQVRQ